MSKLDYNALETTNRTTRYVKIMKSESIVATTLLVQVVTGSNSNRTRTRIKGVLVDKVNIKVKDNRNHRRFPTSLLTHNR